MLPCRTALAALLVLSAFWLAACLPPLPAAPPPGSGQAFVLVTLDPHASATPTPFQPAHLTDTPTARPTETPAPTATLPPTPLPAPTSTPPSTPPPSATLAPSPARTQYTFYVDLDYARHTAAVSESILYFNTTGQSLSELVLAVEPNRWSDCFFLNVLMQDGVPLTQYRLEGQRLTLSLAPPLPAGASTTIALGYNLSLPPKSYEGTFGYLGYQTNLTHWYPFIVPYSSGWVLHEPWAFGEHLVFEAADFEVNVRVSDPNVVVAASAPPEPNGEWTRYRLRAARTFALSASTQYRIAESAVASVSIRSYYFPAQESAGQAVVWMATQSLGLYGAKFAAYPYPSLSVVESELPDGQEYDGLIFLAEKFYSEYNGTAKSNLFTIGTHEIAHQWWFGLVGNDQALEPWLDEALSVYSERLFYEYNYPRFSDWWWNFRVNYFGASGYVDTSVYNGGTFRLYTNAVYLNGANFLEELRARLGDEAFFAFLRDYAARFAHQRASAYDFFALLRQHTDKDVSDIIQRYFQGAFGNSVAP